MASQLEQQRTEFKLVDNAFLYISDFDIANQLAVNFDIQRLHIKLDLYARRYCPVVESLNLQYNWSLMQVEYATDLIFKEEESLQAFYPSLLDHLIVSVKPEDIATFLGRKLNGNYQGEMGNRFKVRWLGRRIKHQMGAVVG